MGLIKVPHSRRDNGDDGTALATRPLELKLEVIMITRLKLCRILLPWLWPAFARYHRKRQQLGKSLYTVLPESPSENAQKLAAL